MVKKFIGSAALTPSSDTGFDLTTKGDTHGYSNTNARIPISTNNFSLLCDSAQSLGLKWASSPTSVLSATGDILYASGANTLARLAVGSNDDILTLAGGVPSWASAAGGGATVEIVEAIITATFTTTSTTFVDITDLSLTKPDITDGKCMAMCEGTIDTNTAANAANFGLDDNGTVVSVNTCISGGTQLDSFPASIADVSDADGNTYQAVLKANNATARILYDDDKYEPKLSVLGVG